MAEPIISSLVENLSNTMVRSYAVVSKSEIESLRSELDLLNRTIEEADRGIEEESSVKVYTAQMRETANLIEDVLDEFDLLAAHDSGFLRRSGVLMGKLISRRNLHRNIGNVKALLVDIRNKGERYGMRDRLSAAASVADDHRRFESSPDEELIGADTAAEDLTKVLFEGENLRQTRAVLGSGGIGKTALVARIYNSDEVKNHFDISAWISVPRGRIIAEEILRLTAAQILRRSSEEATVREDLMKALRERRYLIVFDDVWRDEIWHIVRVALPDNGNGSRVIVTTRHEAVAASLIQSEYDRVFRMKPLSEEASWELFCRSVFRLDLAGRCPDELRDASVEIVGICEGLPLAIKAVGGLLSAKPKVPREWRKLLENFSLEDDPGLVSLSKILALGFDDLPPYLRKCFMYFSLFPKESPICSDKLIKLWIAEGFVKERRGETLEEVAKEYLQALVDRNLVEACQGFYGIQKFCRVHNLMHAVVRKKASDRDFYMVSDGKSSKVKEKCRRLIVFSNDGVQKASKAVEGSQVRSVFLWNIGNLKDSVLVRLFRRNYLLTMLDIENSGLEALPKEVGYLSCLNYLSVKNTRVRKLPKEVRMLSKLEVLDLSGSLIVELPMEIAKLRRLRHLLASRRDTAGGASLESTKGVMIKVGIGALQNLQTLATVDASLSSMDVIQEMKKLKLLRSLRISRLTSELAGALCACIGEMTHLESLHLESLKNETLELQDIPTPPTQIQRLVLKGELRCFPAWISRLGHLGLLCLSLSNLTEDPLHHLRCLPNLESLWLYGAYQGPRLAFDEGFRKLKLLVLREMQKLEAIKIVRGAMPLLEELRIGPSPLLEEVPFGIAELSCLKVMSFYDMPNAFVLGIQPDEGLECLKVNHLPTVLFCYKNTDGKGHVSYRLGEPDLLRRLTSTGSYADTGGVRRQDSQLSFSYSADEGGAASVASFSDSEDGGNISTTSSFRWDNVARSSVSGDSRRSFSYSEAETVMSTSSSFRWDFIRQPSFTSERLSFFSDDIED